MVRHRIHGGYGRKNRLRNTPAYTVSITRHRTGTTIRLKDSKRYALPAGKRVSRTGRIYYENRRNRSDARSIRKHKISWI